jgi:hypothetical protein
MQYDAVAQGNHLEYALNTMESVIPPVKHPKVKIDLAGSIKLDRVFHGYRDYTEKTSFVKGGVMKTRRFSTKSCGIQKEHKKK